MDLLRANILKAKEELNGTGGESTKPGKNDETEQERLKRVVTNYLKSVPPLNGQKSVPQLVCKLVSDNLSLLSINSDTFGRIQLVILCPSYYFLLKETCRGRCSF